MNNDPLWDLYIRASWQWQLFVPCLFLVNAIAGLYFDYTGAYWSTHEGWQLP